MSEVHSFEEATAIALKEAHRRCEGYDIELIEGECREIPEGWVFCYQSRSYLETGDFKHLLLGNEPFVVTRSGEIIGLGTDMGLNASLERARQRGSLFVA